MLGLLAIALSGSAPPCIVRIAVAVAVLQDVGGAFAPGKPAGPYAVNLVCGAVAAGGGDEPAGCGLAERCWRCSDQPRCPALAGMLRRRMVLLAAQAGARHNRGSAARPISGRPACRAPPRSLWLPCVRVQLAPGDGLRYGWLWGFAAGGWPRLWRLVEAYLVSLQANGVPREWLLARRASGRALGGIPTAALAYYRIVAGG